MVLRAAAEHPGYTPADRERFFDEPAKRGGQLPLNEVVIRNQFK